MAVAIVGPIPLYVSRPVVDDDGLRAHFQQAGIAELIAVSDMHVTVAYSKSEVDVGRHAGRKTTKTGHSQ